MKKKKKTKFIKHGQAYALLPRDKIPQTVILYKNQSKLVKFSVGRIIMIVS